MIEIPNKILLPENNYSYFNKQNTYNMTIKQYEEQEAISEFIQWGRKNPCGFAEHIFGIELLDYQKYVFMSTWNSQFAVWCMGRNSGKSILGAIYLMTRSLLVPNFNAYILCGVGSQSIELFTKIEKLTFNSIPSFSTLTDVFQGELVKPNNGSGFTHDPSSYKFHLYNDSAVFTLNGAFDNNRSKRSNCNFYDECVNAPDELFMTSEPFCTQNSECVIGVGQDDDDILMRPIPFPNQLIYASSAGRTDQYLFRKYRECSLRMDAGDSRYFCADISSDVVVTATRRGVILPKPLLTQEVIDARMREDKEAGLREYHNIFTSEGGDGQIIKRSDIIKNSVPRLPEFYNPGDKLYAIAYDPARQVDNSVIGVAEYYEDPEDGWKMRIVNMVSLVDVMNKKKIPINTPSQVSILKNIILDYNGEKRPNYENILGIYVDAGSGGAGVPITDFLCEEWYDGQDQKHLGLIDEEFNEGDKKKYPKAVNGKLHLISPTKFKPDMYESLIKMMECNYIEFTEEYLSKGYINLIYEVGEDKIRKQVFVYPSEKEEKDLKKRNVVIEMHPYQLDKEQEVALKQIDYAKTELVNMYRFKMTGAKDRFDLAPDKVGKLNDDRAYVIALLGWQLNLLRRDHIINKKREKQSSSQFNYVRAPRKTTQY